MSVLSRGLIYLKASLPACVAFANMPLNKKTTTHAKMNRTIREEIGRILD